MSFQDEGTLFAAAGHRNAAQIVYLGLHGLQHRASAGMGIAAADGHAIRHHVAAGTVSHAMTAVQLERLAGGIAIGRLTGTVGTEVLDVSRVTDPVVRTYWEGQLAVGLSGRLSNGAVLRKKLLARGALFQGDSDAEIIAYLLAQKTTSTFVNRLVSILFELRGAWTVLVASEDRLVAARDPRGFCPLMMGTLQGATLFSAEDTPLLDLGCSDVRSVEPGEVVIVDVNGVQSVRPFMARGRATQVAEMISLAKDDSRVHGHNVAAVRRALGQRVALEQPCQGGTVVTGLPGAEIVAQGYAERSGVPLRQALFIADDDDLLALSSSSVTSASSMRARVSVVRGEDVVFVVPAISLGLEVRNGVASMRRAGARRVHVRVASPPVAFEDPYGLAMPTTEELAWNSRGGADALTSWLGADSVGFLALASMRDELPDWEDGWCDTMFSGVLPEPSVVEDDQLPLFQGR
ncbi:MAG: amidophosphoribosyltransferase [Kiritimatiellia bacterium]|jgi:amidophosphoribosyltransferase